MIAHRSIGSERQSLQGISGNSNSNRRRKSNMSSAQNVLKVLFLCTGNSCRSQMAEAWTRHLKADLIEPYSGGVDPRAIKVMAEAGIDMSGQVSKDVASLPHPEFDYVITLCDNAHDACPF